MVAMMKMASLLAPRWGEGPATALAEITQQRTEQEQQSNRNITHVCTSRAAILEALAKRLPRHITGELAQSEVHDPEAAVVDAAEFVRSHPLRDNASVQGGAMCTRGA